MKTQYLSSPNVLIMELNPHDPNYCLKNPLFSRNPSTPPLLIPRILKLLFTTTSYNDTQSITIPPYFSLCFHTITHRHIKNGRESPALPLLSFVLGCIDPFLQRLTKVSSQIYSYPPSKSHISKNTTIVIKLLPSYLLLLCWLPLPSLTPYLTFILNNNVSTSLNYTDKTK